MTYLVHDPEIELQASEATRRGEGALARFLRHRLAITGLGIIVVLVLGSAIGPYLIPFDDLYIDIRHRFAPPFESVHLFGTDPLGRDHLARLMMAGRISMTIGFASMVISTLIGTVIGAVAGYHGKAIGAGLMRFVDAMLCFPSIFLLLTLAGLQLPMLLSGALVTETVFTWPGMGRLFLDSLDYRDYPVVMGVLMFSAVLVLVGNVIADLLYAVCDPRIRLD